MSVENAVNNSIAMGKGNNGVGVDSNWSIAQLQHHRAVACAELQQLEIKAYQALQQGKEDLRQIFLTNIHAVDQERWKYDDAIKELIGFGGEGGEEDGRRRRNGAAAILRHHPQEEVELGVTEGNSAVSLEQQNSFYHSKEADEDDLEFVTPHHTHQQQQQLPTDGAPSIDQMSSSYMDNGSSAVSPMSNGSPSSASLVGVNGHGVHGQLLEVFRRHPSTTASTFPSDFQHIHGYRLDHELLGYNSLETLVRQVRELSVSNQSGGAGGGGGGGLNYSVDESTNSNGTSNGPSSGGATPSLSQQAGAVGAVPFQPGGGMQGQNQAPPGRIQQQQLQGQPGQVRMMNGGSPKSEALFQSYKYKTLPCKFYRSGYCRNGDACTYRHDHPRSCKNLFENKFCERQEKCGYSHDIQVAQNNLCYGYNSPDGCSWAACRFLHVSQNALDTFPDHLQ